MRVGGRAHGCHIVPSSQPPRKPNKNPVGFANGGGRLQKIRLDPLGHAASLHRAGHAGWFLLS
jgi:hypothetical protein